jgi:hypothetical protein
VRTRGMRRAPDVGGDSTRLHEVPSMIPFGET